MKNVLITSLLLFAFIISNIVRPIKEKTKADLEPLANTTIKGKRAKNRNTLNFLKNPK